MKTRFIVIGMLTCYCNLLLAQKANAIYDQISHSNYTLNKYSVSLFKTTDPETLSKSDFQIDALNFLTINQDELSLLSKNNYQFLEFNLQVGNTQEQVQLVKYQLKTDDFLIETSSKSQVESGQNLFYHGILASDKNSVVSLSIIKNKVKLLISNKNGNYEISNHGDVYAVFIPELQKGYSHFSCDYKIPDEIKEAQTTHSNHTKSMNECIEIYIEVDYQSYLDHNESATQVKDWVETIINDVAVIYQNEGINIKLSHVLIWDTADPYREVNGINNILIEFGKQRQNDYQGRLAHLMSTRNLNGGIAWVNVLCSPYSPNGHWGPYGVSSGLKNQLVTFPSYSWTVNVVAHEIGHNFGSRHTHDCVWGPNQDQQIDDCASHFTSLSPKPFCYDRESPIIPSNGGTIMSYCNLGTTGINFSNGFGKEPGEIILHNFQNASCSLSNDCGNMDYLDWEIQCPVDFIADKKCEIEGVAPQVTGLATINLDLASVSIEYVDKYLMDTECQLEIERKWIAIDSLGTSKTCAQLIKLEDNYSPLIINCPTDILVYAEQSCGANVTWPPIELQDNCSEMIELESSKASGSFFNIGETIVELVATDECNLSTICQFKITVQDKVNPSLINCPQDITVNSNEDCQALVDWNSPIVSDNCQVISLITNLDSGTAFDVGATEVVYTAYDSNGNSSQCSFIVTVEDQCDIAPLAINCVADFVGDMQCGNALSSPNSTGYPVAEGGVAPINLSYVDEIIVDTECVRKLYRLWRAEDVNGIQVQCQQEIVFNNILIPKIINCPKDIVVEASLACATEVHWPAIIAASDCGAVDILSTHHSGDLFELGTTSVKIIVSNSCGNSSSCIFTVEVKDTQAPVFINCPEDLTLYTNTNCEALAIWETPIIQDNCEYSFFSTHISGNYLAPGNHSVSYIATDRVGNSSICKFQVNVIDQCNSNSNLTVICPDDYTAQLDCSNQDILPEITGYAEHSNEQSNVTLSYVDQIIVSNNCRLELSRKWLAVDLSSNQSSECYQQLLLTDKEAPIFNNCPNDITVQLASNCRAYAFWPNPSIEDRCSSNIEINSNISSGSSFSLGETEIIMTAADDCGNVSICSFLIIAKDIEAPQFYNCPDDITVESDGDCAPVQVFWNELMVVDACNMTLSNTHQIGDHFEVGLTLVEYLAVDEFGNESSCNFIVEVVEDCKSNFKMSVPPHYKDDNYCLDTELSAVDSGFPSIEGGEGIVNITHRDSLISYSNCHIIFHRIWTAEDENLDRIEEIQIVELTDLTAPILDNIPIGITLVANDDCTAVAEWDPVDLIDECKQTVLIETSHQSGSDFQLGVTEVIISATDACGNINTSSFNVDVKARAMLDQLICPEDQIIHTADMTPVQVYWDNPYIESICLAELEIQSSHINGTHFGVGETTVFFLVNNNVGESRLCYFKIKVIPADESECQDEIMISQDHLPSGTYSAAKHLSSNTKLANDQLIVFNAGDSISLEMGFEVTKETPFEVTIKDCNKE